MSTQACILATSLCISTPTLQVPINVTTIKEASHTHRECWAVREIQLLQIFTEA